MSDNGSAGPLEPLVGRLNDAAHSPVQEGSGARNLLAEAAAELERLEYAEAWIRARSDRYPPDKAAPGTFDSGYALALEQASAAFCRTPNAALTGAAKE